MKKYKPECLKFLLPGYNWNESQR